MNPKLRNAFRNLNWLCFMADIVGPGEWRETIVTHIAELNVDILLELAESAAH